MIRLEILSMYSHGNAIFTMGSASDHNDPNIVLNQRLPLNFIPLKSEIISQMMSEIFGRHQRNGVTFHGAFIRTVCYS